MKKVAFATLAAGLVVAGLAVKTFVFPPSRVCGTFPSPKGHYRLVAYCNEFPHVLASGPGDGQSGSGYVRLYDSAGTVLGEAKLHSMFTAAAPSDILWADGQVSNAGEDAFVFKVPKE